LAFALVFGGWGCGGSEGRLVKVKGVVTLDGKPLSKVIVTFVPTQEGGRVAFGLTKDDGSFQLTTRSMADGAQPGDYKVTLVARDTSGPAAPVTKEEKLALVQKMAKAAWQESRHHSAAKKHSIVPEAYQKASTTPVRQAVPTDGPVIIDIRSRRS
jgi:hypothetical protein